jgi:hypothetical protein
MKTKQKEMLEMNNLEEIRNELIELENKVSLLKDEIKIYRSNTKDSADRRIKLAKMQMELGKYVRRLRTLRGLV